MQEEIIKKLEQIEKEENITILLAVESGSRAWGFASPNSDYDVRFIYKRNLNEYLKLEKVRDVPEKPIENDLDISGWDISKTLKLLYLSNPSFCEWLKSPIVYKKTEEVAELEKLAQKYFSKTKILNHYYHIAVTHYEKHIKEKKKVNLKKYFYILRSIAAALYTIRKEDIAPIEFDVLRNSEFPIEINEIVDKMVKIKKENIETKEIDKIKKLDSFIEEKIKEIADNIKQLGKDEPLSWKALNDYFIKIINS